MDLQVPSESVTRKVNAGRKVLAEERGVVTAKSLDARNKKTSSWGSYSGTDNDTERS